MGALVQASGSTPDKADLNLQVTQFLTFLLDGEAYGVGILAVREIIEYADLTPVPMMPACIRGVMNVRGAVVPVMDMVVRFGRRPTAVTKRTCIVIVEKQGSNGAVLLGMVVDAVNAVIDIPLSEIEPAPAFGTRVRSDLILGMGKVNGKFVVLLKTEQVMSEDDIASLVQQSEAATAEAGTLQ